MRDCKHLDKAFNAYAAGAAAVVIVDSDDAPNIAVADGSELGRQRDLQIPVGMVSHDDGQWLKAQLMATPRQQQLLAQLDFENPIKQAVQVHQGCARPEPRVPERMLRLCISDRTGRIAASRALAGRGRSLAQQRRRVRRAL